MEKLYGLIGYPLGHSFSAGYFDAKFRRERIAGASYRLFPLEDISRLPALLADNPSLSGFNVTMPHKSAVIPFLDELSDAAAAAAAVNCVKREGGRLTGYNTDVYGFRHSLTRLIGDERPRALLLGGGGAAAAAAAVFAQLGMEFSVVIRRKNRAGGGVAFGRGVAAERNHPSLERAAAVMTYEEVGPETIASHRLIVNATPLGMGGHAEIAPPIPYGFLTPLHLLFDMVYNPALTPFLAEGAKAGAATMNGLEMLHAQAERSWEIWSGRG